MTPRKMVRGLCGATLIALAGAPLQGALGPVARAAEPAPTTPAERFKQLSQKAEAAYQVRDYQGAIDAYLEAYAVVPNPDVLYNVAYLYDHHLDNRELAQDFYRRVVRTPDSSKQIMPLAAKRLAELEAEAKAEVKVLQPTTPPSGDPPVVTKAPDSGAPGVSGQLTRPDDGPGALPWVLVGVGGAAVVGGALLGAVALGTRSDYDAATTLADKRALESDGEGQTLGADILMISGGLMVVGGIVWLLAGSGDGSAPPSATSARPPIQPYVSGDGFGLALGGSW